MASGELLSHVRKYADRFGQFAAGQIAWASTATPVTTLQINTLRGAFAEIASSVLQETPTAVVAEPIVFLRPDVHIGDLSAIREGRAYVQDSTAHRAAAVADARPEERILDLCAAPGGKSIAMAIASNDSAEIVACDTSAQRLDRVRENVSRLGLRSIRTMQLSSSGEPIAGDLGRFDAVLVDVPCSNSGVFARRPEARLRLNSESLGSLGVLQRGLLQRAAGLARDKGRIIYSTCSIEPAENEDRIRAFMVDNPAWTLAEDRLTLPHWGPSASDWHDGGYVARLVRN